MLNIGLKNHTSNKSSVLRKGLVRSGKYGALTAKTADNDVINISYLWLWCNGYGVIHCLANFFLQLCYPSVHFSIIKNNMKFSYLLCKNAKHPY